VTGLLSRQHFEENLNREIAKAARYGTPLSLVMIDLDNFKRLNDTCGHIAGDSALATVAAAIRDRTRASDLVARWGGDEFTIASPTPLENTACLAEKIRKFLEDLKHGEFGAITGSFGVTSCLEGDSIESLTDRADELMYEVKRKGGNGVLSE
jgi:diguanylate cyclase (GGDEF)-like protein